MPCPAFQQNVKQNKELGKNRIRHQSSYVNHSEAVLCLSRRCSCCRVGLRGQDRHGGILLMHFQGRPNSPLVACVSQPVLTDFTARWNQGTTAPVRGRALGLLKMDGSINKTACTSGCFHANSISVSGGKEGRRGEGWKRRG